MQIGLVAGFLAVLGVLSRVVSAGGGLVTLALLAVFGFCWLALTLAAVVMTESDIKRPVLQKLFATRSAGRLYRRIIRRPAHWPRDWRMYDWSLRLAVAYPIAFALAVWGWGGAVDLGGVVLIAAEPENWRRAVTIAGLALAVGIAASAMKVSLIALNGFVRRFSGWRAVDRAAHWVEGGTFVVAGAVAVAVTVAGAGAGAGAVAVAVAVTVAVAVAVAGAVAAGVAGAAGVAVAVVVVVAVSVAGTDAVAVVVVVAVASAFVFAFAVAVTVAVASERGHGRMAYALFTLLAFAVVFWASSAADWEDANQTRKLFLLFLGLLPLLNAVFDYLSYLVTFTLLRWGYLRPRWAAVLGVLDLILAVGLFALSGAGIVLAILLANHLAGEPLFPVLPLIEGIRAAPQDYWWVYLMLFSTLLPTVFHMGVGAFSLGALLPGAWRDRLRDGIGAADAVPATLTPLLIGGYWTVCLVAPMLVLAGLGWAFSALVFPHPFAAYLDGLQGVAVWAEGILAR